jgi:hypothetical protein
MSDEHIGCTVYKKRHIYLENLHIYWYNQNTFSTWVRICYPRVYVSSYNGLDQTKRLSLFFFIVSTNKQQKKIEIKR